MIHSLQEIFVRVKALSRDKEIQIKLSYLEIYNECLKDLIAADSKNLEIRESAVKGNTIAGLTEVSVTSPKEIMDLLLVSN